MTAQHLSRETAARVLFAQMIEAAPVATEYYQARAPLLQRIAHGVVVGTLFVAMLVAVVCLVLVVGKYGLP